MFLFVPFKAVLKICRKGSNIIFVPESRIHDFIVLYRDSDHVVSKTVRPRNQNTICQIRNTIKPQSTPCG